MKSPALPLSWKLSLVPAAMALLLLLGLLGLADRLLGRYLEARAKEEVGHTALRVADAFSWALNHRIAAVQLLARNQRLEPGAPLAGMREELDWLQRNTGGFAWIGVTDLEGRVLAATGGLLEGQSIAQRPVFSEGLRGPWVGDVHPAVALAPLLAPTADGSVPRLIDIAMPLFDATGQPRGVLAAHVDWTWFGQLLERSTSPGAGLRTVVLSRSGEPLLGALDATRAQALREALRQRPAPGRLFDIGAHSDRLVAAAAPLTPADDPRSLGWQIVAQQDLDAAIAPVTALEQRVLAGGLLVALGVGAAGWLLSRRLSQPYAGLLAAATERYAGAAGAQREHGLAGYLDALASQLRRGDGVPRGVDDVLGRVVGDAQRLRAMLDQLPAAVYLSGPDDRLLYWNGTCEAMFGWSAAEVLGRPAGELLLRRAGEDPGHERLHQRIAREPGPFEFATAVQRRDGTAVRGEWRLTKLHDGNGVYLGLLAQVRDVTAEQAARAQAEALEHRLQLLTDAAVDYGLVMFDAEGRVTSFNAGAERLTGWRADEVLGRAHAALLQGGADAPAPTLEQVARDGRVEFEGWCRRRDGSHFWGNALLYRIGSSAAPSGYAQVTRDLSQRREAEKARRESEAMLAAVIQSASDAVISTDVQGRIELVNPAAERIFGHRADALLGQPLDILLPPAQRTRHGAALASFAASRVTRRSMGAGRVQGLRADGVLIELEASISQVHVNERQVLTAILRDVTERVRQEHALMQYQIELTELTQRLMAQEKATSRLLAQALHDRLGQTLAALRLGLDALPAGGPTRERLDRLVGQAIGEVRQVLSELRPPLLDEQGLAAALDNEIAARHPLPEGVDLLLDVAPALATQRWPADIEYAAFMIAREAIGNALLHADAALVRVSIEGGARRLALEVGDDGRGLAPEFAQGRPGHLGLVGMRERALAIGARFEVRTPPGEGTTVTLLWENHG
ncbi:MAG TPA: PAS domain S-box protein [Methylibium sp.]|nr:PAS domain S-box protein [Methylibium sp.]